MAEKTTRAPKASETAVEEVVKFVNVELKSAANTTLYIDKHAINFEGGKASVSADVAKLLRDKKIIK